MRRPTTRVQRAARSVLRLVAIGSIPVLACMQGTLRPSEMERKALAGGPDAAPGVDALFRALSRSPGLFARFSEEKRLTVLVQPLRSEGTLHFAKGLGLARHTTSSPKQSVFLANGRLTVFDGKKVEVVRLDRSPALASFADAFALLLAGDQAGLAKIFDMQLSGSVDKEWHLRLVPISPALKKMIAALEVDGKGEELKTLAVRETNGDVTTTTFSDVDVKKAYSDGDPAFRVPENR